MSTQKSMRKKFSSVLATATVALVAASGLALAPTAAFAEPVATTITGTATVNSATETGITVDVAVAGIANAAATYPNGVHVGVVARGHADGAVQNDFIGATASIGRAGSMPADGTVAASIAVPAADLDRTMQYEAVVWPQRSNPSAANLVKVLEFDVTEIQWNAVFPSPAPTLVPKVTNASAAGLDINAELKNIVSSTGAYVSLIEAGTSNQLTAENMGIGVDWVTPQRFTDGSAVASLKAPADKLDRTKSYEVISWRGHSLPTSETIFNVVPLTVTTAQWDTIFPKPATKIPFTDVKKGDKFFKEISWMYTEGVSTGTMQSDNTVKYEPKASVTREAMAAFLFRQYAPKDFKVSGDVKFTDVKKSDKFFKQIAWMAAAGISTGTTQADGSVKFEPKNQISREAMAAFLYRVDTNTKPTLPGASPFADVQKGDKFYAQIVWMYQAKISTGNANGTKKPNYQPKNDVTREAMAAFLYRAAPTQ